MPVGDYLTNLFGLSGASAVVIGGTGVLGGAIADALGAAGARVIVVGRKEQAGLARVTEIQDRGGTAEFFAADCTSRKDLEALRDQLKKENRNCDILINGAGVNSSTPFLEITDEEWMQILDTNLRSMHIACQIFGGYVLDRNEGGSIINIASLSGITPLSRVFTYSSTKAAVINLTKNLAREWAPRGVRVNAISPGFFPAEQNRKVLTPDRIENVMRHTPMGRFGVPSELAGVILLLASKQAGSFITGGNFVVDGGFTAMTI